MGEQNTNPGNDTDTQATDMGAGTDNVDVAELIKDRDKWKHFAREHETKWQTLSNELNTLKAATQTEAERAIEAARNEGRQAAASEYGGLLTAAELEKQAAKAGVSLPDPKFINLSALMSDGAPNGDAIAAFIGTLPKPASDGFPQEVLNNAGNREGNKPRQLTQADLHNMTLEEINAARMAGQLNDLLGIS
jgi:hypothetical protein